MRIEAKNLIKIYGDKSFIEILEKELKERNLTLNKLSKAINYSQSATSQWKKGRMPQIDVLEKICKYLNISADYLLGLAPPEINKNERILLEHYRAADERGQEYILELAAKEAERNTPKKDTHENLSTLKIG